MAKELKVVIVASLFEKRAPGIYHNTAAVLEQDGSLAGIYRKMHIPDDPGYSEKFYFTPGDLGFHPIRPVWANWGYWCAGTSGIRKLRASWRSPARNCCSTPPLSAG